MLAIQTQAEKQKRLQQDQSFQKERVAFEMQLDAANSCAQELDEKEVNHTHPPHPLP